MNKILLSFLFVSGSLFAGQNITLECNDLVPKYPDASTAGKKLSAKIVFTYDDKVQYSDSYGVRSTIDLNDLGYKNYGSSTYETSAVINDHTIALVDKARKVKQNQYDDSFNKSINIKINRLDGKIDLWATSEELYSKKGMNTTFTGTCTKTVERLAPNAI